MRGSLLFFVVVILLVAFFLIFVLLLVLALFRRISERDVAGLFVRHVLDGGWMETSQLRSGPHRARGTSTFGREGTHEASCVLKE